MPRASRLAPAPKGPRSGSMAGMLLLLLALTAMVVLFIMTNKRVASEQAQDPEPERVDPFAHMNYKDDDTRAKDDDAGAKSVAEVAALLESVGFQDEVDNWTKARDLQGEAKDLMAAFQVERADGDPDWRVKAREAKRLYEDAVRRGEVYQDALVAEVGDGAYEAKRLDKLLQAWRRDLMGLRKTVGD